MSQQTFSTDLSITGVILAGGLARRMNGQDKGLVSVQDKPLIEYVLADFLPQINHCIISANRNITQYQHYGYPVYTDEIGDYAGPLAGIATALRHCNTEYLACVPCDAYSLPKNLVQQLYQTISTTTNATICIANDGQRLQPLYALIHKSTQAALEHYLELGGRRVMQWLKSQKLAIADCSRENKSFQNINSL
jgi:molybdenum cofactor guanylyltransferase